MFDTWWEFISGVGGFLIAIIFGVVTLGAVMFGVVSAGIAIWGPAACEQTGSQMHVAHSWTFWGGCYYRMADGRWVPDTTYLAAEIGQTNNVRLESK